MTEFVTELESVTESVTQLESVTEFVTELRFVTESVTDLEIRDRFFLMVITVFCYSLHLLQAGGKDQR